MKHRKVTHIATSVRQRLLNEARATDRPFNELLQYFAMAIAVFLGPVAEVLHDGGEFEGRWQAPGPWTSE